MVLVVEMDDVAQDVMGCVDERDVSANRYILGLRSVQVTRARLSHFEGEKKP
jgi:hypothetical protein